MWSLTAFSSPNSTERVARGALPPIPQVRVASLVSPSRWINAVPTWSRKIEPR